MKNAYVALRRPVAGIALLLLTFAAAGRAPADARDLVLDTSFPPRAGVWDVAQFRIFIPEGVPELRGIILEFHGYGGDSRRFDPIFRTMAHRWHFALMGVHFHAPAAGVQYKYPEKGSGAILLQALVRFGVRSGHREIPNLPFCLWGFSMGGAMSCTFAEWMPQRTIAFVAAHGAAGPVTASPARSVPALFLMGERDTVDTPEFVRQKYETNRKEGALWGLAIRWGMAHQFGDVLDVVLPYLDEMIRARLPARFDARAGPPALVPMKEDDGWLADLTSWDGAWPVVRPYALYEGDRSLASWLPNQMLAYLWRSYACKEHPVRIVRPFGYTFLAAGRWTPVTFDLAGTHLAELELLDGGTAIAASHEDPPLLWIRLERGVHVLSATWVDREGHRGIARPHTVVIP